MIDERIEDVSITLRADHCPGFPPLSLWWISSLTSSRSLGSEYLSFGGMLAFDLFNVRRDSSVYYHKFNYSLDNTCEKIEMLFNSYLQWIAFLYIRILIYDDISIDDSDIISYTHFCVHWSVRNKFSADELVSNETLIGIDISNF